MVKHDGLEVVWPSEAPLADAMVLTVIPDQLIGIEFRRIGRQTEQPQSLLRGLDKPLDGGRTMGREW